MTTFGDQLREFGGVPVSAGKYAGWWGNDVWFVDDEDGLDSNLGQSPTTAKQTIQAAIDAAGPNDTIYLKPRELGGLAYPGYSGHGYYTGTNIIPTGRKGLAIIGTGRGGRGIGMAGQVMIEPTSGSTDVGITVKSPCVSIENLGIKAVTDSNGAIFADLQSDSSEQAWGLTVSNCFFKDFKAADGVFGTINLVSIHWTTIQHCIFREAGIAINMTSQHAKVNHPVVRDCTFTGLASEWSSDIRIGDVKGLEIDDCRFTHKPPSGGTNSGYIFCAGSVASGLISNCYFAYTGNTESSVMTIVNNLKYAHCWGDEDYIRN